VTCQNINVLLGLLSEGEEAASESMYTQHYVSNGYIYGPRGYTGSWIADGYIYGRRGCTRFYFSEQYIYGPRGYTGFWLDGESIYGPSKELPWVASV
jgi:hypothetical protein